MTFVYSFSLWNKFIIHNCINVRKKNSECAQWTCVALLFGCRDCGLVQWDDCCLVSGWYIWTHISSPVIILERNSGFLSGLSWWSWHVLTHFSFFFSLRRQGMHFVAIQCMFRLSLKIFWTDTNQIPNMLEALWIVMLLLAKQVPLLGPHIYLCCSFGRVLSVHHLSRGRTGFELGKWPNKLVFFCLKSYFRCVESFYSTSLQFKAKFDADKLSF